MPGKTILVLGVGNILMCDEGAGVHCIKRLTDKFNFSENVQLLDGGTLGMRLLYPISIADALIVADTAILGNVPGTITKLTYEDVAKRTALKNSMHQVSFAETLTLADAQDILPETTIITIEPKDIETLSMDLTDVVSKGIDEMCKVILSEIVTSGGCYYNIRNE